jgi:hypothetical protein
VCVYAYILTYYFKKQGFLSVGVAWGEWEKKKLGEPILQAESFSG